MHRRDSHPGLIAAVLFVVGLVLTAVGVVIHLFTSAALRPQGNGAEPPKGVPSSWRIKPTGRACATARLADGAVGPTVVATTG